MLSFMRMSMLNYSALEIEQNKRRVLLRKKNYEASREEDL
jgi:hypothetical protein